MQSLKKVISLNQASKISGYTQDYLGYLMRRGEIKGLKKGRVWFTTEEDIKDYLFKKKIRQNQFAFGDFFSPTRSRNIFIVAMIVVIGVFLIFSCYSKNKVVSVEEIQSGVVSDGEGIRDN
jgi:hypothetical protein